MRRPLAPGFALDRDEINERLSLRRQCQEARRESLEAMIRRVVREELARKRRRGR